MTHPRDLAQYIFAKGVAAADPYAAVAAAIGTVPAPALIIAVGKAAMRMAAAAKQAFPEVETLVVTNYENAGDMDGATVYAAGHPVPDAAGLRAGQAVIAALKASQGPVLVLVSGGGSALLPAPATGLTLDDKIAVNQILLGSGLDIKAMNLVRQHLSALKGGGMLGLANGPVTALILSDVIGDDLSAIASGPTTAPLGTADQAIEVLKSAGVWDAIPPAVARYLSAAGPTAPLPPADNRLIGSNGQSLAAMLAAHDGAVMLPEPVEGDVALAAKYICDRASPGVTIWGGETTVQLRGTGKGGRNQELALHIACEAKRRGWGTFTALAGGSDGRDGPVDAAGGIVDQDSLQRIAQAGGDIAQLLANNDSYAALALSGDLLMTGATGTNVADLGVLIR